MFLTPGIAKGGYCGEYGHREGKRRTVALDGPLTNTWGTITSCRIAEKHRHVTNVPHVVQKAARGDKNMILRGTVRRKLALTA